jgi:drug/metabolite transporter (DMT)-like permease
MSERKERLDGLAVSSLLLCCGLWGLNHVATKIALAEVPPLLQASARSLGATVLVSIWARSRHIPLFDADRTLFGGLLAGTLFAAEFACIFAGLQYTTASRMVVFIYLAPFVVALGMPCIAAAERLSPLRLAGLVGAFAGVASAFAEGFHAPAAGPQQWRGDALGVAAAVLWGATTLTIRATPLSTARPEKTLLYQLAVSAALLGAGSFVAGEAWPARLTSVSLVPLAFQTVIVTFASYLLWFWLIRHYPATPLASFTLLTPICGLLAGALLLHEPITPRLITALIAVATGIAVVNRPPPAIGTDQTVSGRLRTALNTVAGTRTPSSVANTTRRSSNDASASRVRAASRSNDAS